MIHKNNKIKTYNQYINTDYSRARLDEIGYTGTIAQYKNDKKEIQKAVFDSDTHKNIKTNINWFFLVFPEMQEKSEYKIDYEIITEYESHCSKWGSYNPQTYLTIWSCLCIVPR